MAAGRFPPSLLLAGPEGVGKKTLALEAARGLLCQGRSGDSCGSCSACSRARRGLHPDLFVIEPATTALKIDQVREAVRQIQGRPFEGPVRVFVIDDAHAMTEQAANALLKSLEEPPRTSHVVLVTAAPQALLPTIRSRCQLVRLGPLPEGVLERHLRDACGVAPADARLRASLAGGSLAVALAFESDGYRSLRDGLLELLDGAAGAGALERLDAAERLADAEDPRLALTALRSLLRDLAALQVGAAPESLLNADLAPRLQALAAGAIGVRAGELAERVADTRAGLDANANKLLSMDLLTDALAR